MVIEKNNLLGLHLKKAFEAFGLLPKKIAEADLFEGGYGVLFTEQKKVWNDFSASQSIRKDDSLNRLVDFIQKEVQSHPSMACVFEDPTFGIRDKNVWGNQGNIFFVGDRKLHYFDHATKDSFSGIAMDSESDTTLYGICSKLLGTESFEDVNTGVKPTKEVSVIDELIKNTAFIITSVFDGECYALWIPKSSTFTLKN